ncbi:hypothetical protein [Saccharopolyspora gloriosae]|uniref:hypothetical protein n=1 Tax=Saccharopolyspora gloriosae TaxID=455344 RepID=UPI001FB69C4F|nr:hypothetical protein [Saccharopolyspora gloriosae]
MAAEHGPDDQRAGYLVVDAETSAVLRRHDSRHRFRSASLVKPLIALDHLRRHGEPSDADRALLEPMLRASHDDAASELWDRGGRKEIIHRMVAEIGLTDTEPPRDQDMWGYVVLTAADMIQMYRHLRAAGEPGAYVLENLRRWTQFGADGFDQSFGIPSVAQSPEAVKQGWSGFGPGPNDPAPPDPASPRRKIPDDRVDLDRPAMHTTGLVRRDGHLLIVALCTLHPAGTDWNSAATRLTELTTTLLN